MSIDSYDAWKSTLPRERFTHDEVPTEIMVEVQYEGVRYEVAADHYQPTRYGQEAHSAEAYVTDVLWRRVGQTEWDRPAKEDLGWLEDELILYAQGKLGLA